MFDRKRLLGLVSASAVICLFPLYSGAQHFFSYRLTGGLANYPLFDITRKFSNYYNAEHYDVKVAKDLLSPYAALGIYRKMTWESYVFLEVEYLKAYIRMERYVLSFNSYTSWDTIDDFHQNHWLYSIPATLGYEKRVLIKKSGLSPFYQIGGSLLYSQVESQRWGDYAPFVQEKISGFGYGFLCAFGVSFPVCEHLAGVVKARARYADGMHFSGDPAGFKAEFSSFDLSAGVEYGY
jgi:hypothetical protein